MANLGPADYNYDETISSLRYANRAKNIKNKAKINEDPKDALLRQLQEEMERLKKQLENGGVVSGLYFHMDSFLLIFTQADNIHGICLSVCLSVYGICLSVCLSVYGICLSVCLSVCKVR